MQSTQWEKFQQALGRATLRIGGKLFIQTTTPLGKYWYCPRAKINSSDIESLEDQAKKAGILFAKIDPEVGSGPQPENSKPAQSTQVQDSLILPLVEADKLQASFHSKTRYNINLATKKGVEIKEYFDEAGIEDFVKLSAETAGRQQFRYHTPEYYRTLMKTLGGPTKQDSISVSTLTAFYQNRAVASIIVLWAYPSAIYLYGASSHADRSLMAPHLLQWQAIKKSVDNNFSYYDFWGIAPLDDKHELKNPDHHLAGVTRFKLGFGGEIIHYPNAYDLVFKPFLYKLYNIGKKIKRTF